MPKGGKRPGAGAPKGVRQKPTLEKLEMRRLFRERVAEQFESVMAAQLSVALGIHHLMARAKDGTWTRVTDPDVMAKVLNSGETFYRIYAQNPNDRALKDILDRLMGTPTQALEVSGPEGAPLGELSDAQIKAKLVALLAKV